MNRLARWIRDTWQKVRRTFYEGPEPPDRIRQQAALFAKLYPSATVQDWIGFASELAAESYRSGYTRGLEHSERHPLAAPMLEDARRHDWSWVDMAPSEEELKRMVGPTPYDNENLSPEDRMLYLDSLGRFYGGFRVTVEDVDGPKRR